MNEKIIAEYGFQLHTGPMDYDTFQSELWYMIVDLVFGVGTSITDLQADDIENYVNNNMLLLNSKNIF